MTKKQTRINKANESLVLITAKVSSKVSKQRRAINENVPRKLNKGSNSDKGRKIWKQYFTKTMNKFDNKELKIFLTNK